MSEETKSIEGAGRRLRILAAKPTLARSEHQEVVSLMRLLKNSGLSNEEIRELADGRWSESTIKGNVKGVRQDEVNPWRRTVAIFDYFLAKDWSPEDMERAVSFAQECDSQGISAEEWADILEAVKSSPVNPAELVQTFGAMLQQGLSVDSVAHMVQISSELERRGLSPEAFDGLGQAARQYGDLAAVLQALNSYGSLEELQHKMARAKEELEQLGREYAELEREAAQARQSLAQDREAIKAYRQVQGLGFGQAELAKVAELAEVLGGPKALFKVAKAHSDRAKLGQEIERAKQRLADLQSAIGKLETDQLELKAAVDLCRRLIKEHRFGLDGLTAVFSVARKYGEPTAVLRAVETYGSQEDLSRQVRSLEAKVAEREKKVAELKAIYDEQLVALDRLHGLYLKVGAEVAELQTRLAESQPTSQLIDFMGNSARAGFDESGPLVAALAVALQRWVNTHQRRLPHGLSTKSGIDSLVRDLGA